ncbi:PREDICTED: alpha-tocopherol transfer protein-like [Nicrophorus vespilloides]|uniref:Alpha-tocopherol transfer protein-like n=1 Tax=Nicrophorus vespilloides TaxID=110193 RepID=A0ABM1N3D5_NICVS|nr:PREDICTED: alpha-tocopherol transfer protein-like [Nicrophorus vespilloides]
MATNSVDVEAMYERVKDLKREDIKILQEWLKMQPHLPEITELQLILFLHSCYYSIEATKKCIDYFYTARTHCPEFFKDRDPRKYVKKYENFCNAPLPKLSPEGYGIMYTSIINTDPAYYDYEFQTKTSDMAMNLWLQQVGCLEGHVIILDYAGSTFAHLTKTNLTAIKKSLQYFQEGFPFRLKALHFCNPPPFLDSLINLLKPIISKELFNMIHVHQRNDLTKSIPADCLPDAVGGTLSKKEIHANVIKNLLENADYFVEDEKKCSDESKRPGKPKNASDLFGVEGTFKKLDID